MEIIEVFGVVIQVKHHKCIWLINQLINVTGYVIVVIGGRFYVDHTENGYNLIWVRHIVINGGRVVAGTNFTPEAPLVQNKMYLNYKMTSKMEFR